MLTRRSEARATTTQRAPARQTVGSLSPAESADESPSVIEPAKKPNRLSDALSTTADLTDPALAAISVMGAEASMGFRSTIRL